MTGLLPAQRRAQAFATAVDADVLEPRFERLLEVVGALREVAEAEPVPSAAYTADLRERLMLAAETDLVPTDARLVLRQRPSGAKGRRNGRMTAAAAAFAVVAGTTGIAVASSSSVPGQSLYPVKRTVEAAQQAVSFGDAARGRDKLDQASARLDEIKAMVAGQGDQSQLPATVQAFIDQGGQGSDLLFRDYQANANDDSVRTVRDFAGTSMAELSSLLKQSPTSLRPLMIQAASMLADVDQQATVLCADCGARSPLQTPSDLKLASDPLKSLLVPRAPAKPVQAKHPTKAGHGTATASGSDVSGSDTSGSGSSGSGSGGSGGGDVGSTVGGVVGGAVGGVTGGTGASTGGGAGGSGGSTGAGGNDPVGTILGSVTGTVDGTLGGLTGN